MSRTYRKCSITEEKSLVKYVNDELARVTRRNYSYKYILTEAGELAYKKAMEQYEVDLWVWGRSGWQPWDKRPVEPNLWEFKKGVVQYHDVDVEEEVKEATEDYKKYKRDGRFYEGNLNRSYKKFCATELRRVNRELARKIVKDDDSWEQKPYPDTYLGKKHVWDYW
jgi:hypothetical protein